MRSGERYIVLLLLIPRLSPPVLLSRTAQASQNWLNVRAHGFAFFTATGRVFFLSFSKLAYSLRFFTALQNRVYSNSKVETFSIAVN